MYTRRGNLLPVQCGRLMALPVTAMVLAWVGMPSGAVADEEGAYLALHDAMVIAVSNSPSILEMDARTAQAGARLDQARARLWPEISVPASVTRLSPADNFQSVNSPVPALEDSEYYRLGLSASWLLFNGGERGNRIRSAALGEAGASASADDARRKLMAGVAAAYLAVQLADEEVRIAEADRDFNRRLLDEGQGRLEAGTASRSDVLNFEIRMNTAEDALVRLKEAGRNARITLAELMGLPDRAAEALPGLAPIAMPGEEMSAAGGDTRVEDALADAARFRPDVRAATLAVEQAEREQDAQESEQFPVVVASGALEGERLDDPGFESGDFGHSLSLALSYTFSDGGLRRGRIREGRARVRELEAGRERLMQAVEAEVRRALVSARAAAARLNIRGRNAEAARENRDIVEQEYRAGQASLVRLNEAQRDLNVAESRLALARVDRVSATITIEAVTGRLLRRLADPPAAAE